VTTRLAGSISTRFVERCSSGSSRQRWTVCWDPKRLATPIESRVNGWRARVSAGGRFFNRVRLEGAAGGLRRPLSGISKKLAVAVECFHKASLIHDDIEDDDAERYGEARSMWTWGAVA